MHTLMNGARPWLMGSYLGGVRRQVEFSNELFRFSWDTKRWNLLQEGQSEDDGEATTSETGTNVSSMPIKRHFHSAVVWPQPGAAVPSTSPEEEENDDKKGKAKIIDSDDHLDEGEQKRQENRGDNGENSKMFVFGGKSNGYLNDLWQYDPGACSNVCAGLE